MSIETKLERVTSSIVLGRERNSFLFEMMGNNAPFFEPYLYACMDSICESYNGGIWEFMRLSNGGFYMYPKIGEVEILVPGNGYHDTILQYTVGIVVTLIALSHYSFQINDEDSKELISELYYKLRDYALDHEDASKIFAAID